MAKKKKAVKKMKAEEKPQIFLTENQHSRLYEIFTWDNPLHELLQIKDMVEPTVTEITFKTGEISAKLEKMIDECYRIIEEVKPQVEDETYDEDSSQEEINPQEDY